MVSRLSPPALAYEELPRWAAGEPCALHCCALGPRWGALCLTLLCPWATLSMSLQESFPLMTQVQGGGLQQSNDNPPLAGDALDL